MPVHRYEIIVSETGDVPENVAVANAAKYLAYSDQTDTVGYLGDIYNVEIYGGGQGQDYGIGIYVSFMCPSEEDRKRFEEEMGMLANVEAFERVMDSRKEAP